MKINICMQVVMSSIQAENKGSYEQTHLQNTTIPCHVTFITSHAML